MSRNCYKINEIRKHEFYQIPKELFENGDYKKISAAAKMLYGILLDRMSLSKKNNWVNEEGEIYLIFPEEDISNLLNISKSEVKEIMKELKNKDLLFKEEQDLNKPSLIYIKKLESGGLE